MLAACGGGSSPAPSPAPPPPSPAPPSGPVNWGTPTALLTNGLLRGGPAAAIDGAGVATVLWAQAGLGTPPSASGYVLARENAGAAWSAATVIEAAGSADASTDLIDGLTAIPTAAGVTASWLRVSASQADRVRTSRRQAASAWDLSTIAAAVPAAARAELAFAAHDATGTQAIAWAERSGVINRIQLRVRRVGPGGFDWIAPALPVQAIPNVAGGEPALAFDATGRLMIVWTQDASGIGQLRARLYDADSDTYTGDFAVDPNQPAQGRPRVVPLSGSEFYAAWEQAGGGGAATLRGKRFTGAAWLATAQRIDTRVEAVSNAQLQPSPNGGALIAWQQAGTLFSARFGSATGTWTQPVGIGSSLVGIANQLTMKTDGSGNGIAVWAQTSTSANDLYYATLTGPLPQASAPTLLEVDAGTVALPVLGVSASGSAVVAWVRGAPGQASTDIVARVLR